jgi:DNA-binding NtrC family response regulator
MVLLIDDDDDFRSALAANLLDDGYRVKQFARPADVPPIASLEAPAMVIIDYQMSGEDGLSFADRFHAVHSDVLIVMVTAYWSRSLDAQVAMRDFIALRRKPIDYEALIELIPDNH